MRSSTPSPSSRPTPTPSISSNSSSRFSRVAMLQSVRRQSEMIKRIHEIQELSASPALQSTFAPSIIGSKPRREKASFHFRPREFENHPQLGAQVDLSRKTATSLFDDDDDNDNDQRKKKKKQKQKEQQQEEDVLILSASVISPSGNFYTPLATTERIYKQSRAVATFTNKLHDTKSEMSRQARKQVVNTVVKDEKREAIVSHKEQKKSAFVHKILAGAEAAAAASGSAAGLSSSSSAAGRKRKTSRSLSPNREAGDENENGEANNNHSPNHHQPLPISTTGVLETTSPQFYPFVETHPGYHAPHCGFSELEAAPSPTSMTANCSKTMCEYRKLQNAFKKKSRGKTLDLHSFTEMQRKQQLEQAKLAGAGDDADSYVHQEIPPCLLQMQTRRLPLMKQPHHSQQQQQQQPLLRRSNSTQPTLKRKM